MTNRETSVGPSLTPFRIAVVYLVFGLAWIYLSDAVLWVFAESSSIRLQIEAVKGTLFVFVSGGLIYWLASRARRSQEKVQSRLQRRTRELSIFHRIVRHNLRNIATVISGRAGQAREVDTVDPHLSVIERKAGRLTTLAEKACLLRGISEQNATQWVKQDLTAAIREICDQRQADQPDATIAVESADPTEVMVPANLGSAVSELLENAIVHSDDEPRVLVTVSFEAETVRITVADDGPSIPDIERTAIDGDVESVLDHSQGVGLWLARVIVENAGGSIDVAESSLGGAAVEITFPRRASTGTGSVSAPTAHS